MLETELTTQMKKHEEVDPGYSDNRNGYKPKTLRSSAGEGSISIPHDRSNNFKPQIALKYKRDIALQL